MLKLLYRDWILYRYIALLTPVALMIFLGVQNRDPEGFFVMIAILLVMPSLFILVNEDKNKGYLLMASLPADRTSLLKARFISIWLCTLIVFLFAVILSFVLPVFSEATIGDYLGYVNSRTLVIYLWVITLAYFILIPLFIGFIGRGLYILLTVGLSLNVLLGVMVMLRSMTSGVPDVFGQLERWVLWMIEIHQGAVVFAISLLLATVVNYLTWRMSKYLYLHRELY